MNDPKPVAVECPNGPVAEHHTSQRGWQQGVGPADRDGRRRRVVDSRWLSAGCEAVTPAIVTRGTRFSTNDRLGSRTNVPHRERIYRQGYPLGRHLIGYELQKGLAVVDWFRSQPGQVPVSVAGLGEGGRGYVRVPQGQARL